MVLGAQPWAAVELLGPSSYRALTAGRHSQYVRGRNESPIQKIYGADVANSLFIDALAKQKRKTGAQQITALPKHGFRSLTSKPLSQPRPGEQTNSLPAAF